MAPAWISVAGLAPPFSISPPPMMMTTMAASAASLHIHTPHCCHAVDAGKLIFMWLTRQQVWSVWPFSVWFLWSQRGKRTKNGIQAGQLWRRLEDKWMPLRFMS